MALVVKSLPDNAENVRDTGSIPGSGRSSAEANGNPLQHPCLENPMDRLKIWTVQRVRHNWSNLVPIMTTRLLPYDLHCIFSLFFLSTLFYSYFFLNLEAEHPTTLVILLFHEYNMSYLGYFLLVLLDLYFSVQFTQLCPTPCNPTDCSMSGLPVLHQLPECTPTHVHWVSDVFNNLYFPYSFLANSFIFQVLI